MAKNYDVNFEDVITGNYILIVLNESLDSKKSNDLYFRKIWKNAKKRILADGASNWLFEEYKDFGNPDFICGDMDSISKEALAFFEQKISSSNIVTLFNQDKTDFDKTVEFCIKKFSDDMIDHFVVIWGQTGRIDHNLACISTLIKYKKQNTVPIYMIDVNNSLSCVLIGKQKIKVELNASWCSIVALGEPSKLNTTGFKWNLNDQELKFGEFISTSNQFDPCSEYCTIICDRPILFSMDFSRKKSLDN